MNSKTISGLFCLVVLGVILSHDYLDTTIAEFFNAILKANLHLVRPLSHAIHRVPALSVTVCAFAVVGWAIYFYLRYSGISSSHREFFELVGITVPVSFVLKFYLQDVFGAPGPREWFHDPGRWGFHWFEGGGYLASFPSGHMAVFTPLMIALGRFYPKYRKVFLGLWLSLAAALVVTNSHFLSDVIGGAYVGVIVDFLTYETIRELRNSRNDLKQGSKNAL